MKTGNLMTAAGLMAAMAAASVKSDIEAFATMMQGGMFRHRGKGRGGVVHNHYGKTSTLPRDGKRERRRRMRQMFGEFAPQRAGWPK